MRAGLPAPRRSFARALACAGIVLVLGSTACAGADPLTPDDRRALGELATIAPRDSDIDGSPGRVECWQPSASMVDDESFRVICRVHYSQAGEQRYRDMICIGELAKDPVTDHCYRWAYYTDMPKFEDEPAYAV